MLEDSTRGNPYKDVQLEATFTHKDDLKKITGFYNGKGKFIIRFMPHL